MTTTERIETAADRIERIAAEMRLGLLRRPRPGDFGRIVEMHGRLYRAEYGNDSEFEGHVALSVGRAAASGFPRERESLRLLTGAGGELLGSIALTDEGEGRACLRWVLLDPSLRGCGLGAPMIAATLADARAHDYGQVVLETFSDLRAAAAIYRREGFVLVSEDRTPRWGRDPFNYQRYELELSD